MKLIAIFIIALSMGISACETKSDGKKSDEPQTISDQLSLLLKQAEEEPDNHEVYYKIARIYQAKKDANNAVLNMQKAIDISADNISYYIYLADLYMEMGQLKNTMMTLQQASVMDDQNTEVMLKTAEIYFLFKKYKETFQFANKALEIDPHLPKAFFIRGFAYKEMGDTAQAISNFMETINNDPLHFDANHELGLLYASKKNPLAINYYRNAISIDSMRIEPYYNLGMFYQENLMENEAIAIYQLIMEIAPKYPHAPYNIGYIFLQVLKIPEEAIPYFTKAIEADPNYAEAYFNRGLSYESLGNVQAARQDYNKALQVRTNYEKAIQGLNRLDRGDIYIQQELNNQ